MAALSATERGRIRRHFSRQGALLGAVAFTKADVDAAVAATDDWIDTNTTSFNSALPVAFRNSATLAQKTLLFCWVAMRRAGILRVEEDG
jgi:hypothetical protein